jgi:hypothetical protein
MQVNVRSWNSVVQLPDNEQQCFVSELCPSSGILNTRKHNVLKTGSVSVVRCEGETPTLLGPLEIANLNRHRQNPLVSASCILYLDPHFSLEAMEGLDLFAALLRSQSTCQIAVDLLLDSLLLKISRYWLQGHELPFLCMRNDACRKAYEFEVYNFVLFDAQSATCRILSVAAGSEVIVTCIHALESNSGIPIADLCSTVRAIRASHGSVYGMCRRVPFPSLPCLCILTFESNVQVHSACLVS